jgi:hypothetical protein
MPVRNRHAREQRHFGNKQCYFLYPAALMPRKNWATMILMTADRDGAIVVIANKKGIVARYETRSIRFTVS